MKLEPKDAPGRVAMLTRWRRVRSIWNRIYRPPEHLGTGIYPVDTSDGTNLFYGSVAHSIIERTGAAVHAPWIPWELIAKEAADSTQGTQP